MNAWALASSASTLNKQLTAHVMRFALPWGRRRRGLLRPPAPAGRSTGHSRRARPPAASPAASGVIRSSRSGCDVQAE